ncbi:uncharacterized protein DNG_01972 [Cephalotrichum gorgonifer]|uniref:Uncharacterized protein n=1 Tax=Cephalotrichum gorgonifer TaxID=2041049 RepID=A0AAE8MRR3_9PEZI|nr:uncharacterized protein DNG_01972 [Cephalotrichum gorgonifer]
MFNLPNAKRVRREELNEAPCVDSPPESEEVRAQLLEALNARMANTLEWEELVPAQPLEQQPREALSGIDLAAERETGEGTDEEELPEVFSFRLFGSSKPTAKVELENDLPFKPGQGGIVARRPASYYFARPSPGQKREYASALVTWEQIMERSERRCWGLERPWKTIATITTTLKGKPGCGGNGGSRIVAEGQEEEKKRRRRLGKKTRIVRRKRMRALEAKKEAEEKARAAKEESLKAKKKRANHAKKVRARAKAKAAKASARGADGGHDGDDGESNDGEAGGSNSADVTMEGA